MNDFIERLKAESVDLQEKLAVLTSFLQTGAEVVEPVHRDLLVEQHAAMLKYAEILAKRLALLDPASKPAEPKV